MPVPSLNIEVNYPSTSSFAGTGQLNIAMGSGPVDILTRVQVRGKVNFEALTFGTSSVEANFQLWAVQWVPHGNPVNDIVSTADGSTFPIRRQLGSGESRMAWTPATNSGLALITVDLTDDWAGQLRIGQTIDWWFCMNPPTGAAIANMNVYASFRWWWYD